MRKLFKTSKKIHKFLGLFLLAFIGWMSLSGIIMNHPELTASVSVPKWLVPQHYHIDNWRRGAMSQVLYSGAEKDVLYVGGKQGVWRSTDGGITFDPYMAGGFSSEAYYRKTNTLFLYNSGGKEYLVAGTFKGLYINDQANDNWKRIPLNKETEKVMRVLEKDSELLAFSESGMYNIDLDNLKAAPVQMQRAEKEEHMSLIQMFFQIHDGKAWGLPGKLLFDLAGIILLFLCITGFYMWYFPKRAGSLIIRLPKFKFNKLKNIFKTTSKWHIKLGAGFAVLFLVIGGTGMFMRPPTLALIDYVIPAKYYPGLKSGNPWEGKIRNAVYDEKNNQFIIDANDGYWKAPADFSSAYVKSEPPLPIFPMGATVFESTNDGLTIGSFNGLYSYNENSGKITDIMTGSEAGEIDNMRPGKYMTTGYFTTPEGDNFITTHNVGLVRIGDSKQRGRFAMPAALDEGFRMPLWNYLFEIHNARFFKGVTGGLYILIIPLGSMGFLMLVVTGIFDWAYKKFRKKKAKKVLVKKEERELVEV